MSLTLEQLPDWLNGLTSAVESPSMEPAFKPWLDEFVADIAKGFQSGESQFGEAWAPLKDPRAKGHALGAGAGAGAGPLIGNGELMQSVISQGSGNIMEMTGDSLRWGTSLPYAADVQLGTSRMPARPFLNVNQDQITRAAERVAQQIIKQLG
jgi:phage gpG-like protein